MKKRNIKKRNNNSLRSKKQRYNELRLAEARNLKRKGYKVRKILDEEVKLIPYYKKLCKFIVREEKRMIAEGYSQKMINEAFCNFLNRYNRDGTINEQYNPLSFLSGAGESLGNAWDTSVGFLNKYAGKAVEGVSSYFKQYVAKQLLTRIGMDTSTVMGSILLNVLENIEYTNLGKYIGEDGVECEVVADLIIESGVEGITEVALQRVINSIFGEQVSMDGVFGGSIKEIAMNAMSDMLKEMRDPIAMWICEQMWGKLAAGLEELLPWVEEGSLT